MYEEISRTWQGIVHDKTGDIRARAVTLRQEPAMLRLERPSKLDRARKLGYKAKEGVIVVRVRVSRGGMRKKRPVSGRRPKHMGVLRIKSEVSVQSTAERRASERFRNMKVIGSYPLWHDGRFAWFECVLIDPQHPAIAADYNYKRILGKLD